MSRSKVKTPMTGCNVLSADTEKVIRSAIRSALRESPELQEIKKLLTEFFDLKEKSKRENKR